MAEVKDKKEPKEKSNVHTFLIILIVSIAAIIGAYLWTTFEYKDRQQKIINAQNSQLSKLDSILGSFYSQSMQLSKDTTYYKVLLDSINKSKNKKQAYVDSIVKSIISASIKAQANGELTDQLRKDSIFVHNHIGQIQNDTKTQLTLEFNKLQNEYQELQLWGGILTIVFLIFTFYSLFKTDDLLKQGRDGLKDIQKIKNDSEIIVEKTKGDQKIISDQFEPLKANISEIGKSQSQNEVKISDLGKEIDDKKQAFQESLKLNSEIITLRLQIAQLRNDVSNIKLIFDSLGEKDEISTVVDDLQSNELTLEDNEPEESNENSEDGIDKQEPK